MGRVRAQALAAQAHEDLPFEQVVEVLQPVRSLAHHPVFQVMFAWQNTPRGRVALPGVQGEALGGGPAWEVAKFDLLLDLSEVGEEIVGGIEYATALFERATVERYAGYLRTVLAGMVADAGQAIGSLPLLGEVERRQVVEEWNATAVAYPREQCVHELFEAQVARTPDAVAVVFEGEQLTYAALNGRANQLARYLQEVYGVGPEVRVALCLERSLELVVALLGVLKAGGCYVPLDPSYPAERLRFMLADSAPAVVLTQPRWRELLGGAGATEVADAEVLGALEGHRPTEDQAPRNVGLHVINTAYVLYTSGSTGLPKGVTLAHRNVVHFVSWSRQAFPRTVLAETLFATSLNFDLAVFECLVPLTVGAKVRLVGDALALAGLGSAAGVTLVNTVPSALHALISTGGVPSSVWGVNLAGEPLTRALVEQIFAQTAVKEVCNLYGPSETTSYSTWVRMRRADGFVSTIGRPIANTQVYVLDGAGEPLRVGVVGVLYIGGAGVARGYWTGPGLTAEKFVPDPLGGELGARLYRTGDLARWLPTGVLEFLGRRDYQVKIRGYRIELGEFVAVRRAHPAVLWGVVGAREDTRGETRRVAYYVVVAGGTRPEVEGLRAYLSERVPSYMVPAAYVELAGLPLTPNGKVDRRGLPAPEGSAYATPGYEAPVGVVEEELAAIWAEVLGVERVGRQDDFFALGGHSLLAVTLIEQMRERGLHASVRTLFATPTLAALAATVREAVREVEVPPNRIPRASPVIAPEMLPLVKLSQTEIDCVVATVPGGAANVQDIYPLAPLQKGILFHHLLNTETDPYVLASLLGFDTRGRLDAYVAVLQAVVERHDILRTAVVWEGLAEPVQVVWRHAPVPIEDVTVMPEVGWWRRTRLDIRQAPLLRGYVSWDATHAGGQGRWLLSLLFHHLVLDHLTLEVVQDEIIAHLTGRQAELPPPLPFRNFVAQARLGDRPAEHERYFRALLEDVTEPTTPFGLVEVRGDGSGISEAWLAVEAGLARRLRARARALGVSVASLCHVAWAQVLARVTGRTDVVFGTVLLGRMGGSAGADRALGLFINTLPVRVRVEGVGAEAAVRGMQRQLAELLEHEHASLALAQRCSGVPASSPLFSSLLNYRHSGGKRQPLSPETVRALEGIERLASEDRSNYPVGLSVDNWGEGLGLIAQVEAPAEPGRVCGLMATALERLVGVLDPGPGTALATVDVLPAAERRQVVEEWNATAVAYPREQCVHDLFEAQEARTPHAVAVVFEGEQLTYAALNGRANQLARYLQEVYGVGPEVRVALCLERSLELVVALLGVLKAGGCYVPLDPSYPAERLRFMLADSAPAAVLTHGPVLAQGAAELWAGLKLPVVDLSGPHRPWAHAPTGNPTPAQLQAMQAAYMIYTSGSTGQPKGVVIPHRGVTNLLEGMRKLVGITARDRLLSTTTIAFDIAALELFLPMLSGACTILVPVRVSTDASVLADAIVANEPTVMQATPSAWRMLLDAAWSGGAVCGCCAVARRCQVSWPNNFARR